MSEEQQKPKTSFLAAGIANALPPKNPAPPPPPLIKRPKERGADDEQLSENANSQIRKKERAQTEEPVAPKQEPELATSPTNLFSEEQLRMLANMINSANATTQQDKKAKRQKIDLADLLIQTIANTEGSEQTKKQFSNLANSQKAKINQGIFAPEALFSIYRNSSVQLGLLGKKTSMGDLMAKALIAYVPEIIKELEQE